MCHEAKECYTREDSVPSHLRAAEEAGHREQDSRLNQRWLLRLRWTRQLVHAGKLALLCRKLRQRYYMPSWSLVISILRHTKAQQCNGILLCFRWFHIFCRRWE